MGQKLVFFNRRKGQDRRRDLDASNESCRRDQRDRRARNRSLSQDYYAFMTERLKGSAMKKLRKGRARTDKKS